MIEVFMIEEWKNNVCKKELKMVQVYRQKETKTLIRKKK
jgi:hypothetical protein